MWVAYFFIADPVEKRDYDIDVEPCDYLDCFSSVDF